MRLSEEEEQILLMRWAAYSVGKWPELAMLFHVPNGGRRGKAEAGRFKDMGVKAGVPDLFLPVARGAYHGFFIEMKRETGGKVSPEQKEWHQRLIGQGYAVMVCHGCEEAVSALNDYLGEGRCDGTGEL